MAAVMVATVSVVAYLAIAVVGRPAQVSAATGAGGQFVAVQGRLIDTRSGQGGYSTPMSSGSWRVLTVAGQLGMPTSGVGAVVVNFTVLSPSASGSLYADKNEATPNLTASYMDFVSGTTQSNTAIVAVAADGKIQVMTTSTADLLVDVQGYYTAGDPTAGGYAPVDPTRTIDTRAGVGLPQRQIAAGETDTIQVSGRGHVPAGASAVVLNVTITNQTYASWFTVYPADKQQPIDNVNFPITTDTQSMQVALSSSGAIKFYSSGASLDLVVDVIGYFAEGSSNGSLTPTADRVYDSRTAGHTSIPSNSSVTVPVSGYNDIPSFGVAAVAANVEVITPSGNGWVVAWASNTTRPATTSLNYSLGPTTSNMVTTAVGTDGKIQIYNYGSQAVDFVVNVEGYYLDTGCSAPDTVDPVASISSTTTAVGDDSMTLSALVADSQDVPLTGEIYVMSSNGWALGGSPTATASVESGDRVTYQLPLAALTAGQAYTWFVHISAGANCVSNTASAPTVFTAPNPADPQSGTTTSNLTGSLLTATSSTVGPTDCSGSPCPLTPSTFKVGGDGSKTWLSRITADLSSIPSGSVVTSATLNVATQSCLTGGSGCTPSGYTVSAADADTSAVTDGAALAQVSPYSTVHAVYGDSQVDVTDIVSDWVAADHANYGFIATAADPSSSVSGASFKPPNAPASPLSLTITFTPPAVPSAPTLVSAVSGDSGAVVSWGVPTSVNYVMTDTTTIQYTVTVSSAGGVVATYRDAASPLIVTGLTNGSSYTFAVTATSPAGTSPPGTAAGVSPSSVTGGSASYTTALSHELNAEDQVQMGRYSSGAAALAGYSDAAVVSDWMNHESQQDLDVNSSMTASNESETADSTSITSAVVAKTSSTAVTVYAQTDEVFTTVDNSFSSPQSTPGEEVDETAYTFDVTSTPRLVGSVRMDAALNPVTGQTSPSAYSAALDGGGQTAPSPLARNADGTFATGGGQVSRSASSSVAYPNMSGIASWAKAHYNKDSNKWSRELWGSGEDCTDFVSTALNVGGGLPQHGGVATGDYNAWYLRPGVHRGIRFSHTWSVARNNFQWQEAQGAYFVTNSANAYVGDVIWVNWGSTSNKTWTGISHDAIVTKVSPSGNLYVTQHSNPRLNEPVWKDGKKFAWVTSKANRHLIVWIADPQEKR